MFDFQIYIKCQLCRKNIALYDKKHKPEDKILEKRLSLITEMNIKEGFKNSDRFNDVMLLFNH